MQRRPRDPFIVHIVIGYAGLNSGPLPPALGAFVPAEQEGVGQKKQQDCHGHHRHVHEEHLGVKAITLELDDLDGLIEHGVKEEVALGVPIGQVDGQADRATCKTTRHLFALCANKSQKTM